MPAPRTPFQALQDPQLPFQRCCRQTLNVPSCRCCNFAIHLPSCVSPYLLRRLFPMPTMLISLSCYFAEGAAASAASARSRHAGDWQVQGVSWEQLHMPLKQPLAAINGSASMVRSLLMLRLHLVHPTSAHTAVGVAEIAPLPGMWCMLCLLCNSHMLTAGWAGGLAAVWDVMSLAQAQSRGGCQAQAGVGLL